jgi:hypothetical protein
MIARWELVQEATNVSCLVGLPADVIVIGHL